MKKVIMVLFSTIAVGFIFFNIANAKTETDLFKMASILEKEKMDIHKWSLHAREQIETGQRDERLNELMGQYPDWTWTVTEGNEKWEAIGISTKDPSITETLSLLSSDGFSYLLYEVSGNDWNSEVKRVVQNSIYPKFNAIFHENVKVFSCLFSELGGNMNESVSASVTRLLQAFQAKEVETLKEKNFVSTTSYSPLFSGAIQGETEQMNLQLGFRNQGMGEKTTLVVGTPIITIEY
jgi:hypothetical protein